MSEPADKAANGATQRKAATGGLAHYFAVTRGPWYGFLFALPLLLAYEFLVWTSGSHVVNGADATLSRILMPLFSVMGTSSREVMLIVLLAVGGVGCLVAHRRRYQGTDGGRIQTRYFIGMLAESVVYAILLAPMVNKLLHPSALQLSSVTSNPVMGLAMAFGAGVYEELFFRVLLMGGLAVALTRSFSVKPVPAWLLAALVSSLVFSAFHYVGSMGDTFSIASFLFRFGAGVVLAAIYGLRGFGIAVWTHAIFDLIMLFRG